MQVLLDECLSASSSSSLLAFLCKQCPKWGGLVQKNGTLLRLAETRFDVFITADQNVEYQQHLQSALLGIIVLAAPNNRFATLHPLMAQVQQALASIQPGDLLHIRTQ